jgi:hypothetical protein
VVYMKKGTEKKGQEQPIETWDELKWRLRRESVEAAIAARHNIVFDLTGATAGKIEDLANYFHD